MRLRTWLALLWTIAIVVAGVTVTVVSSALQTRALRNALELRGETLARSLARRCERVFASSIEARQEPSLEATSSDLREATRGLWEEEELLLVEVVTLSGRVLAKERSGTEGSPFRVAYPVRAGGGTVALVRVEISRARLAQETASIWRSALLIAAVLVLAGTALSVVLTRTVTRRIEHLARAASCLAQGDHDSPMAVRGRDEVGDLGRAFEAMRAQVVEREDRLQEQNLELHRLAEAREALTHMIVHDLKSPVATIRSGLDAVCEHLPAEEAEIAGLMRERADRSLRLIADLLDVHRLEAGRLVLERSPIEAEALCQGAAAACGLEAREKRVEVRVEAQGGLLVSADQTLVERVLINLIANALRHGGGTPVRVTAVPDGMGACFSVEDEGPGVPNADRERIFEMFAQVERQGAPQDQREARASRAEPQLQATRPEGRAERQRRGGAGVGLAFCKLAIQAHGGRIWVESEEHHGSRFCFTLPLA